MLRLLPVMAMLSIAMAASAKSGQAISTGESTFSLVTEDGVDYWLRRNKSDHVRRSQLHIEEGDLRVHPILFLEEHESRGHIGIKGTKSRIRLTAWKITTSELEEKLWVIEEEADAWKWEAKRVTFTKYGCCDAPDRHMAYRVRDGVRID